jgi:DNA polymerase III epsilon subunit-like protein
MREASKPSEKELVASFITWTQSIGDITFAGENPSFDRDFLRSACFRYKFDWPFAYRTIDLHSIGYAHLMGAGKDIPTKNRHTDLGLDKILAMLGLPTNPLPHNALRDAVLEAESYSRLVSGQSLIPEFAVYPVPPAFKRQ